MAKVENKYTFEKPNYKFDDSPLDDRVVTLEQKFSRLTLWTSLLTFLLVVTVIGAVIVQIVLNGKTTNEENSTTAALARHAQRSVEGGAAASAHSDMKFDSCCHDLALKLLLLEQRFQEALSQLEQHKPKVVEPPSRPHQTPNSHVSPKPSGEGHVLTEIIPETFVEKGIEYDYPDDVVETGSGDDSIFIDSSEYDYDSREKNVPGSGIGPSISDDEDLALEASGCRPFARPVCSDGCVTDVMQAGCPVPVCCKALPEPDTNSQSSGHHHHHHHH